MKPILLFSLIVLLSYPQTYVYGQNLSKKQVADDLAYLDSLLLNISSYQGLNGYSYKKDFESYIKKSSEVTEVNQFALFLTKTIGNVGDRHSQVRGYKPPNSKFLPFIVAPYKDSVVALKYDSASRQYIMYLPHFKYLQSINGITIDNFLKSAVLEEILAPSKAFFTRGVEVLSNMELNYFMMNIPLPQTFTFTFSNEVTDTTIQMPLHNILEKYGRWQENLPKLKNEELNDPKKIQGLFRILDNNIGYIRIPHMASTKDAPVYYQQLRKFMIQIKSTKSLIIDIRGNTGGKRHLTQEFAGYFIPENSIYLVNLSKQRSNKVLDEEMVEDLNHRYLFSYEEHDSIEKKVIDKFLKDFRPQYNLPDKSYSPYYYTLLNGSKLKNQYNYFYGKPIYILMNERCFSAASVFASVFKDLPNIKLVGVTTDGSSGNSEEFILPNSKLEVTLSTMVSFQKDGKILDGNGTQPDIIIKRNMDQIFWKKDHQLDTLISIINTNAGK